MRTVVALAWLLTACLDSPGAFAPADPGSSDPTGIVAASSDRPLVGDSLGLCAPDRDQCTADSLRLVLGTSIDGDTVRWQLRWKEPPLALPDSLGWRYTLSFRGPAQHKWTNYRTKIPGGVLAGARTYGNPFTTPRNRLECKWQGMFDVVQNVRITPEIVIREQDPKYAHESDKGRWTRIRLTHAREGDECYMGSEAIPLDGATSTTDSTSTDPPDPPPPDSTSTPDPPPPDSTRTTDPPPPDSTRTTDPPPPDSTRTPDPPPPDSTSTTDPPSVTPPPDRADSTCTVACVGAPPDSIDDDGWELTFAYIPVDTTYGWSVHTLTATGEPGSPPGISTSMPIREVKWATCLECALPFDFMTITFESESTPPLNGGHLLWWGPPWTDTDVGYIGYKYSP